MEIAVRVKDNTDSKGSFGSMLIRIDTICIIAPKARMKIDLEDLFEKNTTRGKIPRLKIRTISGI